MAAAAGASAPQAEVPREVLLLARIQQQMRQRLARMPDYTCLETVERFERQPRWPQFRLVDTVRLEVAHVGDKELYSLPGARKFEESDVSSFVTSGMTASGEFVQHLRAVFTGGYAQFTYGGEEELDGQRVVRYSYSIAANFSGYRLRVARREGIVGSSGSFWADPQSFDVVRLEVRAEEIPPQLPVQSAVTRIDYGKVRIGASEALLPQIAELELTEVFGRRSRNRTQFTECRQYVGESTVMFVESEVSYGPPAKKKEARKEKTPDD